MKSPKRGRGTSAAEVVNVSAHGFWLHLQPTAREYFVPFDAFPWFADASIRELMDVEVSHGHLLRWPSLDVDLDLERIEFPERFPLVARARPSRRSVAAAARGA